MHKTLLRARDWYGRFERPISTLSLFGGFVFNIFTLTRVDEFIENFWVALHILVVGVCIVLINRQENQGTDAVALSADPARLHFWMVNILQFFFGGLISTFIVFYARESVFSAAWPFFVLLIIAFIANEKFKRHYARIDFQISFFFLSLMLFAIFAVPVALHSIGPAVFLLSGGVSLLGLVLFIWILKRFTKERFKHGRRALYSSVIGIYIVMNALYFLHVIPPLPLSLHDSGIYHSVAKRSDGDYAVAAETLSFKQRMLRHLNIYPAYHAKAGTPAYAYSAIFSPGKFNITVKHVWKRYDAASKKWMTASEISLPVVGGREGGYRTYSVNNQLTDGRWRVDVTTENGQLIGRMTFDVAIVDEAPEFVIEVKR